MVSSFEVTRGSKDALVHFDGNPVTVIEKREGLHAALATCREKDTRRMRVAGVPEHFDDDVLDAADIVLGLAPFRLGGLEAHETVAEPFLDGKVGIARNGFDEIDQVVSGHCSSRYMMGHEGNAPWPIGIAFCTCATWRAPRSGTRG